MVVEVPVAFRRGLWVSRYRYALCAAGCLLMAATVAGQVPALAAPARATAKLAAQHEKSVPPGRSPAAAQPPADASAGAALTGPMPAPVWPVPGTVTLDVSGTPAARAGAAPLSAAPMSAARAAASGAAAQASAAAIPGTVRVQTLSHGNAAAAGRVLDLAVARGDASPDAAIVDLTVSYAGFARAFGGDWANRLRLQQLPACALTTPQLPGCAPVPMPYVNDAAAQTVTATVDLPATAPASARALESAQSLAGGGVTMMTLTSGPSSGAGDFAASPLKASSTWSSGAQSGAFTWSYPLDTPPAQGGPEPDLSLNYDSQSVDGAMAASNNQPGIVGEGFAIDPGSVTRNYKPCSDDLGGNATNTVKTGDQCWASYNATLSLQGHSGELIRDDGTGAYHLKGDDGTKVQLLTDSANANGDNNNEYWLVTTTDGTRYYFGMNHLPGWASGKPTTSSVSTVPVFGNNPDEPCYNASFASAYCSQAWQWHLDYVVDTYGNSMSLWYTQETNKYARDNTATAISTYQRAAYLKEIDYGTDTHTSGADSVFARSAPLKVVLGMADRCVTSGATCVPTSPSNWPDVPWDQSCTSTASCTDSSPTFFTQKRLDTVTTYYWDAVSAGYLAVNLWTLHQSYLDPGDGTRAGLWLSSISRQGKVGGTASVPDVSFSGIQLKNRVGIAGDQQPPMNWWRLANIFTETGEHISVVYDTTNSRMCAPGATPTPASNTSLCYPIYWTRPLNQSPTVDWFNKYVVKSVTDNDMTGGAPAVAYSYSYGTPAWHYDEDNGLVPASRKTWAQWRGFSTVTTTTGDSSDVQQSGKTLYFQGMNGDKTSTGTRSVSVADSTGTSVSDDNAYAGMVRETITYNGPGGAELSGVIDDPWKSAATATRTVNGYTVSAYHTGIAVVHARTDLDGGRGARQTEVRTTFNANGTPTQVWDRGDLSATVGTTDDTCETKVLLSNAGANIIDALQRDTATALPCGSNPASDTDIVADTEYSYDGLGYGAAPTKGDVTRTQVAKTWSSGAETWLTTSTATLDSYGRPATTTDVRGNTTTATYTPATGGPVTGESTVLKSADGTITGWTTSQTIAPAWGSTTETIDVNGHKTDIGYDPLGRTTAVWQPNRNKTANQTPNTAYAYTVSKTAGVPSVVTTSALNASGTYISSYTFYDGAARTRQVQTPGASGGRVITDTIYNSTGLTAKVSGPYFNGDAGPSTTLFPVPLTVNVPSEFATTYDGAGRAAVSRFLSDGVLQWQTTTSYGGDRTDVTAPSGGTVTPAAGGASSTILDADGRAVETRDYPGATPTGTGYSATHYAYNAKGQLLKVTDDAAGTPNTWTYGYDLLGRKTSSTDPDQLTSSGGAGGKTAYAYNDAGDLLSTTDPMSQVLTSSYDALGRMKTQTESTPTEQPTQIAAWTYDTAGRGMPASSTRIVNGNQYTQTTVGYTAMDEPAVTRLTIPASESDLAGTYTFTTTYNVDGSVNSLVDPAIGDLAAETLNYAYDPTSGLASRLTTDYGGTSRSLVTGTVYTSFGEPNITTFQDSTTAPWAQQGLYYDPATRRLSEAKTQKSTAPVVLADTVYSYDAEGDITRQADTPQGGAADVQCFTYDALQRLTAAWTPGNGDCAAAPAASALGGVAPYWQSWTFDTSSTDPTSIAGSTGNRLTETNHATAGNTTTALTYPAPGAAQPHAATGSTATGPGGTTHATYSYNHDGQTTGRPGPAGQQTLAYNPEGDLLSLTDTRGAYRYVYDASGDRLIARDPTGATLYVGDTQLRFTTGTAKTAIRYYAYNGQTIAQRSATALQFTTADPHGTSTIAVTDNAAQAVVHRYQTPYGETRGVVTAWTGTKSFVGGDQDPTGLIHEGAREYDPYLGRFTTLDPIFDGTDPQSWNGYAYADNNPVLKSDPTGTIASCVSIDGTGVCGSQLKSAARRKILNDYEAGQSHLAAMNRARHANNQLIAAAHHSRNPGRLAGRVNQARQGIASGRGITEDEYEQDQHIYANLRPKPQPPRAPACHGFFGCAKHGLSLGGKYLWHHRGQIASALATAGCLMPAVGWASCAGLQAMAFGMRTWQRVQDDGGWHNNMGKIVVDGVLTAGSVGVGGAMRMAQFGKLGSVKGTPLVGLPKWVSKSNAEAMAEVQTDAWNKLGVRTFILKTATWSGPAHLIGKVSDGLPGNGSG